MVKKIKFDISKSSQTPRDAAGSYIMKYKGFLHLGKTTLT